MSNLIDSSLPEEDPMWEDQQQQQQPSQQQQGGGDQQEQINQQQSTGFGSSPFDDYQIRDDFNSGPFGAPSQPPPPPPPASFSHQPPPPFQSSAEGDLLNMASEEIKHGQSPSPVPSAPEPVPIKQETAPVQQQQEVKPAVDVKKEEPKPESKPEAKEIKQQQQQQQKSTEKEESKPKQASSSSSKCECVSILIRYPHLADLVYWRDVKKSGIFFGAGLLLLLSLACCSIISVIANGSLLILGSTLVYRIYSNIMQAIQKTDEGHPFKKYLEMDIIPSEEKVHELVDKTLKHLNIVLLRLKSIFLVEDIVDSIKYFILFWCLTYVGSWFNGITLITLTYIGLFSIPKLYEMNKTQIDTHLALVRTQLDGVCSQIKTKLPFLASKKEKAQ